MSEHRNQTPSDYDELFPGRFLKAGLFRDRPVTLTITGVNMVELPEDDGSERPRAVVSFAETPKGLVLNRTNAECIKAMFGRKVPDWIGKRVTFVPEEVRFGRKTVPAIRVQGSPDLEREVTAEICLPRRKPIKRRLAVTGGDREPGAEG